MNREALRTAALEADAAFTRELVRVYGKKNAGDARYNRVHADARCTKALEAKLAADRAYFAKVQP